LIGALVLFSTSVVLAQNTRKPEIGKPAVVENPVRHSAAYAEMLLLRTELDAEIEALAIDYTDEYPKLKEGRFKLALVKKELDRLLAVKPAEVSKLTLALGKMMVRKVELDTDFWILKNKYNEEHPDVKRAKRRVEIFEASIREVLG